MKRWLVGLAAASSALFLAHSTVHAPHADAYVKDCRNPDPVEWGFGVAPSGCDADAFGDIERVRRIYGDVIFDRTASDPKAVSEYVTNLHALMRELATDYIRRREPKFSNEEVNAWVEAIMAVGMQESFLSHYRIGVDGRMKLMTGDSQDSHGIMQINQKYHAARNGGDNSFDLVGNLLYGIDHFYLEFKRAEDAPCIRKRAKRTPPAKLFEMKVRSAYSAYNGGAGAICRWTKPRHPWAKNDKNFYDKLTDAAWKPLVSDRQRPSPVRVDCLAAGDELCATAKEPKANQEQGRAPLAGRSLVLEDGRTCAVTGANDITCAISPRTFQCLSQVTPSIWEQPPLRLKTLDAKYRVSNQDDRDGLCAKLVPGLVRVGDLLRIKREVFLRNEIGGPIMGSLPSGSVVQVIDYDIRRTQRIERHYRVHLGGGRSAYVFAGDETDHGSWAQAATEREAIEAGTTLLIPRVGSEFEVARAGGIAILSAPSAVGKELGRLAAGERITVDGIAVRLPTNEVYAHVIRGGVEGYVYLGRTFPEFTISEWVKVLP